MTKDEQLLQKRLKRLLKTSQPLDQSSIQSSYTFSSYKNLCETLKLPIKTGNSKQSQLKHLEYFCDLRKSPTGNSYTFTTVHPDPDALIIQEKFLAKSIETILLASFLKQAQSTTSPSLIMDTHTLWRFFGFINEKYGVSSIESTFLQSTQISKDQLREFKSRCRRRFDSLIVPALNTLADRALIAHNTVKLITIQLPSGEHIQTIATTEEMVRILKYEQAALSHFKCSTISDIWAKNLETKFYPYLNDLIRKKESGNNWIHVANGIHIICVNDYWLKKGLDKNLDELNEFIEKHNINQEVLTLLQENAETKLNNYLMQLDKEYDQMIKIGTLEQTKDYLPIYKKRGELMEDNYLENQNALMEYFIHTMPKFYLP